MLSRRSILAAGTALGAASQIQGQGPKNIVISSNNGFTCCEIAMAHLNRGNDTLDAVIAGFTSPQFVVNDDGKSRHENCVYLYERK